MTDEHLTLIALIAGLTLVDLYLLYLLKKARKRLSTLRAAVLMLKNGMDVPDGVLDDAMETDCE